MSERNQRQLYTLYKLAFRLNFFIRQSISQLGWLVLTLAFGAGFMSMGYPREPFFALFGVLAACILVAFFHTLLRRGKLRVKRQLPRFATVGEELHYSVECSNQGRSALSNYFLVEWATDPTPSYALFASSREPGEEKRNAFDQKFLAYRWIWMVRRRLTFRAAVQLGPRVAAGERVKFSMSFTPLRRGHIHLTRMRMILPDVLGVFQKVRKVEQSDDTVIVLPKRYAFSGFNFEGPAQNQIGGDSSSDTAGDSGEFVSLREYRPGDPPKHIHWPSWGKTGKPIIKEYEDVFFPRYGLVLDTAVAAHQEQVFEEAISIAATFSCAIDTQHSLLDLLFVQQGARVQTVGRNVERVDSILEMLAGLDMEASPDWKALSALVLKHAESLSTCIVLLCSWDEEREKLVESLVSSGVQTRVLLVVEKGQHPQIGRCAAPIFPITVGEVPAGLAHWSSL